MVSRSRTVTAPICLGFEVIGYAERSTDLILTAVTLTNVSSVIELAVVVLGKLCVDLLCAFVQLLGQWKHTDLNRCQSPDGNEARYARRRSPISSSS